MIIKQKPGGKEKSEIPYATVKSFQKQCFYWSGEKSVSNGFRLLSELFIWNYLVENAGV